MSSTAKNSSTDDSDGFPKDFNKSTYMVNRTAGATRRGDGASFLPW